MCLSGSECDCRIESLDVCPARRDRVDTLVSWLSEEDAMLAPGVGEADELEPLTSQGMERVDDYELRRIVTTGCS